MDESNSNKFLQFRIKDGQVRSISVKDLGEGSCRIRPALYISFNDAIIAAKESGFEGRLLRWVEDGVVPSYVSPFSTVTISDILSKTVEGREFIESVLDHYGFRWHETPSPPTETVESLREVETTKGRWRSEEKSLVEEEKASKKELFSGFIELAEGAESFVYVLELLHKEGHDTAYYVGRSSSPFSRIKSHYREQGDFSGSENYVVTGIDRVEDESEMSEGDVYSSIALETGASVYGGK